jgi:hypothetical protein
MASLTSEQLEDLQTFLKDWLRHSGRTQSDLRRALRAGSIRMPVLLEELNRLHAQQGLVGLAERLCGIEDEWAREDPMGQLDLLLEEIRQDRRI